jgi:hypothetical protein
MFVEYGERRLTPPPRDVVTGQIPWRNRQEELLSLRYRPQTREEAEASERGAREWEAALARSEAAARIWGQVLDSVYDDLIHERRGSSRTAKGGADGRGLE